MCVCVSCTVGVAEQIHRRPIKLLTNCVYTGRGLTLSLSLSYTHTGASVSRALQPSIRAGRVRGVCACVDELFEVSP